MLAMEAGVDYTGVCTPFYCNDGKGNFLLHKRGAICRDEQGAWDTGSGRLGFGQSPEESVLREVMEEYGLVGEIQEKLPAHSIILDKNGVMTQWIAIPFFIKVDITKAKRMEPDRAVELGVFRLDSLPTPLHTGLQKTMSMFRERFEKYKG
jgi:8-oxo-dGTP pyrophosphatase MutT (NUDIX family)